MDRIVTLKLPSLFVGQILDCLSIAIEDWHRTRVFHEDGIIDPDEPYIRECDGAHEAEQIENYYRKFLLKSKNNLTAKAGSVPQLGAERNSLKKSNVLTDAYVLLKFLNDEIQSVQNDLLLQEYEVMIVKLEKIIGWIEDQTE